MANPLMCMRTTFCIAVVTLLALAAAPLRARAEQTGFWLSPGRAPYRALIDAYRERRIREAIDGVRALETEAVVQIIDDVRERDTMATDADREPLLNEKLFQAAAMLHLDVANSLWRNARPQAAAAQLGIGARWVELGAQHPEPAQSFRRRWYRGAGLMLFERGGWQAALPFVDRACEALPDDVPLLTTAAWLHEQSALTPVILTDAGGPGVRGARDAKRDGLAATVRLASAALAVNPDATEAALRLVRARLVLEEVEPAKEMLLELVDRTDLPVGHAYLARLMLGRLYTHADQSDQDKVAERLFREAGDLLPEGQSARVALAQLLDARGDRRAAADVLEPILTAAPGGFIDPWADYLMGTGEGPGLRVTLRADVWR